MTTIDHHYALYRGDIHYAPYRNCQVLITGPPRSFSSTGLRQNFEGHYFIRPRLPSSAPLARALYYAGLYERSATNCSAARLGQALTLKPCSNYCVVTLRLTNSATTDTSITHIAFRAARPAAHPRDSSSTTGPLAENLI